MAVMNTAVIGNGDVGLEEGIYFYSTITKGTNYFSSSNSATGYVILKEPVKLDFNFYYFESARIMRPYEGDIYVASNNDMSNRTKVGTYIDHTFTMLKGIGTYNSELSFVYPNVWLLVGVVDNAPVVLYCARGYSPLGKEISSSNLMATTDGYTQTSIVPNEHKSAVLNYDSFDIGKGKGTKIKVPASVNNLSIAILSNGSMRIGENPTSGQSGITNDPSSSDKYCFFEITA